MKVTDSLGNAASPVTYQVNVNSQLTISVTPSNPTIDSGQTVGLMAQPSGGSGSYASYQWYVGASCSGTAVGASASFTTPALTSTSSYCVKVTDSLGGTGTAADNITVNPSLSAGKIVPISPTIDNGQNITLCFQ